MVKFIISRTHFDRDVILSKITMYFIKDLPYNPEKRGESSLYNDRKKSL
jgi:hypothetical protein